MRNKFFAGVVFALIWTILPVFNTAAAEEIDPILKYYVSHADTAHARLLLTNQSVRYSFEAFTYYKIIGRGGVVERIDSSVTRYFCTGPIVDSLKIVLEPDRKIPDISFEIPNVFTVDYEHSFFPNDVGGQKLALSFAPVVDSTQLADGIAIVDREKFNLMEIYLYYPNPEGYKRLTRSFRFNLFSGFVYPDSIWEVGARQGIFTTDYYRLETKIQKIQLLR